MDAPHPDLVEVRRVGRRRAAELSLVLEALGLPHRILEGAGQASLQVPPAVAEQARHELERYELENRAWPPRLERFRPLSVSLLGPAVYALILALVHSLSRYEELGSRLFAAGRVEGAGVRSGELWRTVTALTLHVDITHVVGNLFLGAALGHLCAQVVGTGVAWLGILVAGALGNLVNVWIQDPTHRSVGASTAVFGALGLLASLQWRSLSRRRGGCFLRVMPFLIAGAMVGYLGTAGERTDIGAHVTGVLAGAWLGILFSRRPEGAPPPRLQLAAGLAALLLVIASWWLALGASA